MKTYLTGIATYADEERLREFLLANGHHVTTRMDVVDTSEPPHQQHIQRCQCALDCEQLVVPRHIWRAGLSREEELTVMAELNVAKAAKRTITYVDQLQLPA